MSIRTFSGFSEIFNTLLQAGAGGKTDDISWTIYIGGRSFVKTFISIAGYMSRFGQSEKLLRLVLSIQSAEQVNNLMHCLSERRFLRRNERITSDLLDSTMAALKLIEEVETPYSLQHLARRSVRHSMSSRRIRVALSFVDLPKSMKKFLAEY